MSTPKGMKCMNHKLASGDRVLIYSNPQQVLFQIRHQTPTEENILDPSFKVAVALTPADALLIASELLTAAVPHLTNTQQEVQLAEEQATPSTNGE
ncbi:hypothetical protein ccbrp13_30310 [Ktedonobacteria bacterium brp13]|nr:hypothetical protein ccbrp13_30310 [Ktedonobacteria bacterium brp13]